MKSHIKILIVEDELVAAEFLALFLRKEGYDVIGICEKGVDAILMSEEMKPDVIFMDIYLKDHISGCDAALKIVSKIKTKIIFLTAYSNDEMLDYATDIGAINYLIKPYNETQILVALKIALGQPDVSKVSSNTHIIKLAHGYTYNILEGKLYTDKGEVPLSGKGYKVVSYLCKHHEHIVSSSELAYYIYGNEKPSSTIRALI